MATKRSRKSKPTTSRSRRADALDGIGAEEARDVLFALLERHPDLRAEAVKVANAALTTVDSSIWASRLLRPRPAGASCAGCGA